MDSKKIKIAALQMCSVVGERYANYKKVKEIIEKEPLDDSDVLILPEVWTVGWSCEDFDKCAEPVDNSETIEFLSEISKKNHINIYFCNIFKPIYTKLIRMPHRVYAWRKSFLINSYYMSKRLLELHVTQCRFL